jgi:hypothetical protein
LVPRADRRRGPGVRGPRVPEGVGLPSELWFASEREMLPSELWFASEREMES